MDWLEKNVNPRNKKTGDCIIRALSVALDKPYENMYRELFEYSLKVGWFISDSRTYEHYLKHVHAIQKIPQPKKASGGWFTINEFFTYDMVKGKTYIVSTRKHLTVIKDGMLVDSWNCKHEKVCNYYVVPNNQINEKLEGGEY